ncbi:glycosyltransferase [Acinetobacter silvestris]|uniref:Glycosyl transferase n=1 Tax=Acinetobacter silvestris TaxID=1977882 RepID=A0A1Y3C9W9_9GAMM|nr:glycosyltransferase [Acinetobacter silvestris]OTG63837.1 glycosyl transferase [Acinetobacter silvestris]
MKILYLITGLGGGGAEKVVVDLADQMVQLGHEVKIAYLKGEVIVELRHKEIELVYLKLEIIKDIKSAYQNYKKLLESFKPDVVHAHMVHANIFSRISRKFSPIPRLICTAHSNNEGGKLRMLAYKLTHDMADMTTNVSTSACESFEKLGAVPKSGIYTVYNGIDLNKFKFSSESRINIRSELELNTNKVMILAVGRFHEAKNFLGLIRAFKKVIEKNTQNQPELIIAGDGELRLEIEQLIQALNLTAHVKLLGRRDDIPALMSAADLFVLSSNFEGFGLVVAEAMACKTFVVATDCGGVKEVMGGYGLMSPVNDMNALAKELSGAIQMSHLERQRNNELALKYVKDNFDLKIIVNQWLETYESK